MALSETLPVHPRPTEVPSTPPGSPSLAASHAARPGFYEKSGKRALDVVLASAALVAAAPAMAAVALAVRISMGPGVIYSQERVGRNSQPFNVLKFRSMNYDRRNERTSYPGEDRRITHKTTADPRHTRLGRFIRKTSLDELPQLINVLRGDMSLVGPRPELFEVAEQRGYLHHPRHRVRPGITGVWQTSPDRSGYIWQNLHHDETYVAEVSLRNDLQLLARTPAAMTRNVGA